MPDEGTTLGSVPRLLYGTVLVTDGIVVVGGSFLILESASFRPRYMIPLTSVYP